MIPFKDLIEEIKTVQAKYILARQVLTYLEVVRKVVVEVRSNKDELGVT